MNFVTVISAMDGVEGQRSTIPTKEGLEHRLQSEGLASTVRSWCWCWCWLVSVRDHQRRTADPTLFPLQLNLHLHLPLLFHSVVVTCSCTLRLRLRLHLRLHLMFAHPCLLSQGTEAACLVA